MSLHDPVYDLGEVDLSPGRARAGMGSTATVQLRRPGAPHAVAFALTRGERGVSGLDWPAGLSTVLPGAGQMVAGHGAAGLAFLAMLGLIAALGWALLETMDRLAPTLVLLGYSRAGGVWALGVLLGLTALLHMTAVLTAGERRDGRPAILAVVATGLLPGWGQALQGRRAHAALFLAGLWTTGLAWLLVAPPVVALLADLNLVLPGPLAILSSAVCRWTLPAVFWTLAVYDTLQARG